MYEVTEKDKDLAREFKENPIGHHSPELQRLLNVFRGEPMEGKYVLVCTKPHEEWVLGQLTGVRGDHVQLFEGQIFHDIKDAEWEVFKRRWKRYAGEELDIS